MTANFSSLYPQEKVIGAKWRILTVRTLGVHNCVLCLNELTFQLIRLPEGNIRAWILIWTIAAKGDSGVGMRSPLCTAFHKSFVISMG